MYLGNHAAAHPNQPAVIDGGTGQLSTYAELDAAANRLARVLRDAGVRPGDRVAFCLENHPRFLEIAFGCHYAGAIYTACSSRLTRDELAYIVNDCGATVFITSSYKAETAEQILTDTPNVTLRLMLDGAVAGHSAYEPLVDSQPSTPIENRIAGVDMLYSSGTTGRPKGVLREFTPQPLETASIRGEQYLRSLYGFSDETVYLSPAPLYHAAPLHGTMNVLALGGTVVTMAKFDPEEFLALIQRYRVTHSQVVPTMFVRLLKVPEDIRQSFDVSSLRWVLHGAAPCPVMIKQHIIDWLGPIVHEYYGATEGTGGTYCTSEEWLAHPGTVGIPLSCTVHIVDDEGTELPVGATGTIFFEGGADFKYLNDPGKTRQSRNAQGWSTLGDVGYLDKDGYLYLTDRKAYMIISGGVNVYPQEAENVLLTHPKVMDAAVFGIPNEDFGEEVKAVVQPVTMPADTAATLALEAELIAYCRKELSGIKCPRSVDFRTQLPRHPTGKLYKRALKDEYWSTSPASGAPTLSPAPAVPEGNR